jgi:polycomb protein EED
MMGITLSSSSKLENNSEELQNSDQKAITSNQDTSNLLGSSTYCPPEGEPDTYDDLGARRDPLSSLQRVPSKRKRPRTNPPLHTVPLGSVANAPFLSPLQPLPPSLEKTPAAENDGNDNKEEETNQQKYQFTWSDSFEQPMKAAVYALAWSDKSPVTGGYCVAACLRRNVTLYSIGGSREEDESSERPMSLLHCYVDADPKEDYYACVFCGHSDATPSTDHDTDASNHSPQQLLCVGGKHGIIHILDCIQQNEIRTLSGHGDEIFDLKRCPTDPWYLLSASKDHSCRLWNLRAEHASPVAIFGGHDGHGDAVNSIAWHSSGTRFVSGGMDNTVKVWEMTESVHAAMASSERFTDSLREMRALRVVDRCAWTGTALLQFPIFSSKKIHVHCVDCVEYFGDLVLSKSTESVVRLWLPQSTGTTLRSPPSSDMILLRTFVYTDADVWYVRFGVEPTLRLLAVGNMLGSIFVWNVEDMRKPTNPLKLRLPKAATVRYVSFSPDGTMLLASTDDGLLHRWTISGMDGENKSEPEK